MLQLRPTCEQCNIDLPPDSTKAMICSYECTYCRNCVDSILRNVCPNCGGGFCARPARPKNYLINNNYPGEHPASTEIVYKPVDFEAHRAFAAKIKGIPPTER